MNELQMANEIKSDDMLPSSGLDEAHKQWSEKLKLRTAQIIVSAGLFVAVLVVFLPLDTLAKFHENAWTLITVIVSSALGFLYSARDKN